MPPATTLNLADNYALIRAAWTAMDQTYGTTKLGWHITSSLEEPSMGGKPA